MRRLAPFILAGGAGFVTDAAILFGLATLAGFDPFLSRIVSFTAAVCVTWAINRGLTFGPSGRPVAQEGARYGGVAVAVGLFNYVCYAGLLLALPSLQPVAALTVASAVAMTLSWLGYSRLVFTQGR